MFGVLLASSTDASIIKLNIIYVSFIFAISRWLYLSAFADASLLWPSLPIAAN